jgi:hypothetical protein
VFCSSLLPRTFVGMDSFRNTGAVNGKWNSTQRVNNYKVSECNLCGAGYQFTLTYSVAPNASRSMNWQTKFLDLHLKTHVPCSRRGSANCSYTQWFEKSSACICTFCGADSQPQVFLRALHPEIKRTSSLGAPGNKTDPKETT